MILGKKFAQEEIQWLEFGKAEVADSQAFF
jgi:hypothetical protein